MVDPIASDGTGAVFCDTAVLFADFGIKEDPGVLRSLKDNVIGSEASIALFCIGEVGSKAGCLGTFVIFAALKLVVMEFLPDKHPL